MKNENEQALEALDRLTQTMAESHIYKGNEQKLEETIRKALQAKEVETGLQQIIDSQKQTFDALMKKYKQLDAQQPKSVDKTTYGYIESGKEIRDELVKIETVDVEGVKNAQCFVKPQPIEELEQEIIQYYEKSGNTPLSCVGHVTATLNYLSEQGRLNKPQPIDGLEEALERFDPDNSNVLLYAVDTGNFNKTLLDGETIHQVLNIYHAAKAYLALTKGGE